MLRYFTFRWLDRRLMLLIPNPFLRVAIIIAVLMLAFGRRRSRRVRVYPARVQPRAALHGGSIDGLE